MSVSAVSSSRAARSSASPLPVSSWKNPPILILDEATSALDNESEILVGQSLEKLAHGRTTLTIAHRLTTIKNYDRILVLGSEGIVESGTHEELLAKQGVYYRLWNQLPGEDTL